MSDPGSDRSSGRRAARRVLVGLVAIAFLALVGGLITLSRGTGWQDGGCGAAGGQSGCIAETRLDGTQSALVVGPAALTADGTQVLFVDAAPGAPGPTLRAMRVADGAQAWAVPLDAVQTAVSLSPRGDVAAVWQPGNADIPIRLLAVPAGTEVGRIAAQSAAMTPYYSLPFTPEGDGVMLGPAGARTVHGFPAGQPPRPLPGSRPARGCGAVLVGQSNTGTVTSYNGRLAAIFLASNTAMMRLGRLNQTNLIERQICGTDAYAVIPVPQDPAWRNSLVTFAAFSPDDNRLAVIYNASDRAAALIEIRDTTLSTPSWFVDGAGVIASFPIEGGVIGYGVAWSADNRLFAALIRRGDGFSVRVYRVP